jgi:hypothetical protein
MCYILCMIIPMHVCICVVHKGVIGGWGGCRGVEPLEKKNWVVFWSMFWGFGTWFFGPWFSNSG